MEIFQFCSTVIDFLYNNLIKLNRRKRQNMQRWPITVWMKMFAILFYTFTFYIVKSFKLSLKADLKMLHLESVCWGWQNREERWVLKDMKSNTSLFVGSEARVWSVEGIRPDAIFSPNHFKRNYICE
jgi:hypothetical protein